MLFSIKRRLGPTLLLFALFAAVSVWAHSALAIPWDFEFRQGLLWQLFVCLVVVVIGDFAIHALLWFFCSLYYRPRYRALVEHFRGQRTPHILGSGVLAAGEELFFRGVVLAGLLEVAQLGPSPALGASALAFGLLHLPREQPLHIFGVVALWEGVVLGAVYLLTGSLLLMVLLHLIHDIGGYTFFAVERRFGVWLRLANHATGRLESRAC